LNNNDNFDDDHQSDSVSVFSYSTVKTRSSRTSVKNFRPVSAAVSRKHSMDNQAQMLMNTYGKKPKQPTSQKDLNKTMGQRTWSNLLERSNEDNKLNKTLNGFSSLKKINHTNNTQSTIVLNTSVDKSDISNESARNLKFTENDEPRLVPNIVEYKAKALTPGLGTYDESVIEL